MIDDGIDFWKECAAFENSLIASALQKADGNHSKAAELLKINRSTFQMRLKQLNIKAPNETRIKELTVQLDAAEQEYIQADKIRTACEQRMMFIEKELEDEKNKSMIHAKTTQSYIKAKGWESLL